MLSPALHRCYGHWCREHKPVRRGITWLKYGDRSVNVKSHDRDQTPCRLAYVAGTGSQGSNPIRRSAYDAVGHILTLRKARKGRVAPEIRTVYCTYVHVRLPPRFVLTPCVGDVAASWSMSIPGRHGSWRSRYGQFPSPSHRRHFVGKRGAFYLTWLGHCLYPGFTYRVDVMACFAEISVLSWYGARDTGNWDSRAVLDAPLAIFSVIYAPSQSRPGGWYQAVGLQAVGLVHRPYLGEHGVTYGTV